MTRAKLNNSSWSATLTTAASGRKTPTATVSFASHPRWTAELHWEGRVERATAPSKQEAAAAVAERILCRPVAPAPVLTLEARVTALETEVAALRALIRPLH